MFSLEKCTLLITLILLIITLSSTAFAKTVTETKTFRGGSSGIFYKKSEACQTKLKKYEKQRVDKACSRVKGKLKIDNIDCDCSQNTVDQWHCKKTITATCTYDSKNMKPITASYRNVFGIKKKPSNKITQTQVLKSRSALNSRKRCMRLQKQEAVDKAKFGCRNVIGKMKLLKYDCECISAAPNLYDCVGLLKASCTFDKGQIKSYKEFDSERARSRHGFGMLEDMIQE